MLPVGRDSNSDGHTNHKLGWSTSDGATNLEFKMTRLGTLKVMSDETMNLGS